MKRWIVTCAFAVLLLSVAPTQAQVEAPFYGVISGSAVTDGDFQSWKGGLQLGTAIPFDQNKGLVLRTLYTKASFGDGEIEAIRISPLLSWYAGKRWTFYVVLGGDAPLTETTDGAYFVGLGASRRIFTSSPVDWLIPFSIDGFFDLTTADRQGDGSNVNQFNLGLQFSKPVKR